MLAYNYARIQHFGIWMLSYMNTYVCVCVCVCVCTCMGVCA